MKKSNMNTTKGGDSESVDASVTPKFGAANLNDLNGPEFWRMWEKAGGDPDEYVKETMPNFGIVGALLLTITVPLAMEPVPFAYGDADAPGVSSAAVVLYAIMLNVSTATSMAQIIISVGLYQQYVNCFSKELRVGFAAKFGYIVGVLTTLLIVDSVCLFIALFISLAKTYTALASGISIIAILLGSGLSLAFYTYMTIWNSNTYTEQMMKELREEETTSVGNPALEANKKKQLEMAAAADQLSQALAAFSSAMKK